MNTIICKKCGAVISADEDICPECGAIYYVLDRKDSGEPEAQSVGDPPPASERGEIRGISEVSGNEDTAEILPTSAKGPERTVPQNTPRAPRPANSREMHNNRGPQNNNRETQKPPSGGGAVRQRPPSREVRKPPGPGGGSKDDRDKRRKLIVAALCLAAVLTVILFVMSGALDFGKKDEGMYMPNVIGLSKEAAEAKLVELGVRVEVKTEESSEQEGTVVRQETKPGKKLQKNETVYIVVSGGQSTVQTDAPTASVPSLMGKTFDEAKIQAEELGLYVIVFAEEYSERPEGEVIGQDPVPGTQLERGEVIKVTVSLGVEPTPTPTEHTISVTAGKGGTITPKGMVTVVEGQSITFIITPEEGYVIREVKVDGVDVGAVGSYTFEEVDKDHTIYAVFQVEPSNPSPNETDESPDTDTQEG